MLWNKIHLEGELVNVLRQNYHSSPTEEISTIQEGGEEKCLKCVEGGGGMWI